MFFQREKFWQTYPALLYGLYLLFGLLFSLSTPWVLAPTILILFTLPKKKIFWSLLLFCFALLFANARYHFPENGTTGRFLFRVQSKSDAGNQYLLRGTVDGIPCRTYCKKEIVADRDYFVTGTLTTKDGRSYLLKSKEPFEKTAKKRLAEMRYQIQSTVRKYIEREIPSERTRSFLITLVTGSVHDDVLYGDLKTCGLAHLMAISGFHFAILALFFHLLFRNFLPYKVHAIFLLTLLTLYFFFIGSSPSIMRAWIFVTVYLMSHLMERRAIAGNTLGVALIISLLINPLDCLSAGFQLSFLATGGILFLTPAFQKLLVPKIPFELLLKQTRWQQATYIINASLSKSLAASLAVHITLFPLLIHLFHSFSLHSMIYNLFFPPLTAITLILFLLGLIFGHPVHALNSIYTDLLLQISEKRLLPIQTIYFEEISLLILTVLFILLIPVIIYNNCNDL